MKEQDLLNPEIIKTYDYRLYIMPQYLTRNQTFIVNVEGKKLEIPNDVLLYRSTEQLTWLEFYNKVNWTEGILKIEGNFKED